jgi:hypothetical protein
LSHYSNPHLDAGITRQAAIARAHNLQSTGATPNPLAAPRGEFSSLSPVLQFSSTSCQA